MAAAAVTLGGTARIFHFVESGGVEADGKGVDRCAARGGQGADDGRAVGAAGEERRRGRCIGVAHGFIQHCAKIVAMRVEAGVDRGVVGLPVEAGVELAVLQGDDLSRQQFVYALVETARRRDGVEIQVIVDRLGVDDPPDPGMGGDVLHAAAEHQMAAAMRITESFGTDAIEDEAGSFLEGFQHGEGEIALHQRRQFFAVAHPSVRDGHGGIAVAGDEGQLVVQKDRAPDQRGSESVFNVDVGLAEARTCRHAQHLAAVFVQQPFRGEAGCASHVSDQILMRAVVAQPAKNAIHGVLCQRDTG